MLPAARIVAPAAVMSPPSRTVMVACALIPSDTAVIDADPGATPVTVPSFPTDAFELSELDHMIVRTRVCPLPVAAAASFTDAPGTIVAVSRSSVTAVTAMGTGSGPGPTGPSLLHARPRASVTATAILFCTTLSISCNNNWRALHIKRSVGIAERQRLRLERPKRHRDFGKKSDGHFKCVTILLTELITATRGGEGRKLMLHLVCKSSPTLRQFVPTAGRMAGFSL